MINLIYWLSRLLAYTIIFLDSFAFMVMLVVVGMLDDVYHNGMGVLRMTIGIMEVFLAKVAITDSQIVSIALIPSSLFAFLLTGALFVSARNGEAVKSFMLGVVSYLVSMGGITFGMFKTFPFKFVNGSIQWLWSVVDWQNFIFANAMAIVPILTFALAANQINKKFKTTLETANDMIVNKVNSALTASIESFSSLTAVQADADIAEKMADAQAEAFEANKKLAEMEKQLNPKKEKSMSDVLAELVKNTGATLNN